jgi:hypothetical protein
MVHPRRAVYPGDSVRGLRHIRAASGSTRRRFPIGRSASRDHGLGTFAQLGSSAAARAGCACTVASASECDRLCRDAEGPRARRSPPDAANVSFAPCAGPGERDGSLGRGKARLSPHPPRGPGRLRLGLVPRRGRGDCVSALHWALDVDAIAGVLGHPHLATFQTGEQLRPPRAHHDSRPQHIERRAILLRIVCHTLAGLRSGQGS